MNRVPEFAEQANECSDDGLSDGDGHSEGRTSFFADPRNWSLFYYTARNMNARQLAGVAERKLRHAVVPRVPIDFDARYERRIPSSLTPTTEPIRKNTEKLRASLSASERDEYRDLAASAADGRVTFLNRTIAFGDEIDWHHEKLDEYPLLWRLKLQAFEQLEWLVLGYDRRPEFGVLGALSEREIGSWLARNPIGEERYLRRSWIPHSVSLRILNWCRYAAWLEERAAGSVPDCLFRAIYKNASFLENHVEYDVGGNHLVENAVALVMAGVLFRDHDTGWIKTGRELLRRAGRTQFLADGGHFERSPMYHVMVLRRYATAYDLLRNTRLEGAFLEGTAERAIGFLEEISEPNDAIPLLNDSVYGEQIEASSCLAYCDACGLASSTVSLNHPDGSGYRKLVTDAGTLLIDVGEVGPSHLPAHSHNDQLSVLLWIDGDPILTDTGVFDYAPTQRRRYSRSVEAHNTAQFEAVEPIRTGGSYLMGKRTAIQCVSRPSNRIAARYARNPPAGAEYTHERTVTAHPEAWVITDEVSAPTDGEYTVRYHFDTSLDVSGDEAAEDGFVVRRIDDEVATIDVSGNEGSSLSASPRFERYGERETRPMVAVTSSVGNEITTRIKPNRSSAASKNSLGPNV